MRTATIDQKIIDRAVSGDKEAYATLVRATGSRSLIVAERILRSPDDAISAARKFFVMTYVNLKKLKNLGVLELWLMQNLVRVCGESIKEATKKGIVPPPGEFPKDFYAVGLLDSVGVVDPPLTGGVAASIAASAAHPRSANVAATRREAVRKAIDHLPFLERTAIIFRDWDGISYLEVAEILRVKQDEMRKLLVRGRKGVAEMLQAQAGSGHGGAVHAGATGSSDIAGNKNKKGTTATSKACGKIQDKLWLFVGGEVGPIEIEDIRTHLTQCPGCDDLLKTASLVLEAIRDAAPLEDKPLIAPEMLWKEVEPLLVK